MSLLTNITNYDNTTRNTYHVCQDHEEGVIIWSCITVVTFVFGFPTALAVLWDELQKGRKRSQITPYDIFLTNITLIDGLFLLFNFLEMTSYTFWYIREFEVFVSYLYSLSMCGRPLFTTCICVDCCLAVVHPVFYRAHKSLTPRVLTAVAVWTVTFIFGILCFGHSELPSSFYVVSVITLTLPIMAFCDATILWTLRRLNPAGGSIHPKKKKALQIITNNIVVTFTSYLPPVIAILVSVCLNLDKMTHVCLVLTPVLCSMLAGNAVSPILHLSNLGKLDWLKSCVRN